jgi:diguanylate cyclase (GGDEF)-like protein
MMGKDLRETLTMASRLAAGLLVVLALYVVARNNYLLYHTLLEGFSLVLAALIYVLTTRTYKYSGNDLLLFLGNAYLFIAVIDFFHIVTYKGMDILPVQGANTATQLWIAGGYLLAVTFLLAAVIEHRHFSARLQFWAYAAVTSLLLLSIMWLRNFPVCYIDGRGPTVFRTASDYLISVIMLAAMLLFYRRRSRLDRVLYQMLMAAMACIVLSELSYLYVDTYGVMNFVRYLFKLASYVLIYEGVVIRVLDAPFDTIFHDLKASAVTDNLTGLYNRQGFRELLKSELFLAQKRNLPLGLLMMDIDKFKSVNDRFGHLAGDEVLKEFAELFRSSLRGRDIACRLGGDEFTAIVRAGQDGLRLVEDRIRVAFYMWSASSEVARNLGLSIGSVVWEPGRAPDAESLIMLADKAMYKEKEEHGRT